MNLFYKNPKFYDSSFFSEKSLNQTILNLKESLGNNCNVSKDLLNNLDENKKKIKIKKNLFQSVYENYNNYKSLNASIIDSKSINENSISKNKNQMFIRNNPSIKYLKNKIKYIKLQKNKKSHDINFKNNLLLKKGFEDYLYGKIFVERFKNREKLMNNRLNLIYSENIEQYQKLYSKRIKNKKLVNENLFDATERENNLIGKVNYVKNKINFIKGVIDYSFPEVILYKINIESKNIRELQDKRSDSFRIPFEREDYLLKKLNKKKTEKLSKSFSIINFNNKNVFKKINLKKKNTEEINI
jgi:hypothetical protein